MNKLFLAVGLIFTSFQLYSQDQIILQEGTVIKFIINEDLNSRDSKVGDLVNFEVSEDVVVDSTVIIKKGDKAVGQVSRSSRAKRIGKKGELDFTIDYVTTFFGKNIRIKSNNDSEGKSRMGGVIAGAAIIGAPILLFIKGKDVTINKGTFFSAFIDKDYSFTKTELIKNK